MKEFAARSYLIKDFSHLTGLDRISERQIAAHLELYAGYVRIDNQSNASYTFAINPYPVPIGGKLDGWVLGMAHFF